MTLEEYASPEQDFSTADTYVKTFLKQKGVSLHTYYYWKRKSRDLKEESLPSEVHFLPIDIQPGGSIKPSKRGKSKNQPLITQGEIEIELRTPSTTDIRIRGIWENCSHTCGERIKLVLIREIVNPIVSNPSNF